MTPISCNTPINVSPLYHTLLSPVTQLNYLQQIQNALASAVTHTPKHSHITPAFKPLYFLLNVVQCMHFKIIFITHNLLHKSEQTYLPKLITIKPCGKIRYLTTYISLYCPSLPSLNSLIVPSTNHPIICETICQ